MGRMLDQYKQALSLIGQAQHIVIIQPENPDGDSLGSALALEQLLTKIDKTVTLCGPVDIPRYLRYFKGWDRIQRELPPQFDLSVIVDNPAQTLLEKFLTPANTERLHKTPMLVIDHHGIDVTIEHPDRTDLLDGDAVSAGQMVYELAKTGSWEMDEIAGPHIAASILSDSMGLTTEKTSARSIYILAELVEKGHVNLWKLDKVRREYSKRSLGIVHYKMKLIERTEFFFDNKLALAIIPLDEIKEFSDKYNPAMLVLEELRNVDEVDIIISIKIYDDHVTAKLRANYSPICNEIASAFGGGGHPYAAGIKIRNKNPDEFKKELVELTGKLLKVKKQ